MIVNKIPLGQFGANCYVICDALSGEGAVIDPGEFTEGLNVLMSDSGIKELKYILLTHGHFDHILGVYELKRQFPNAEIAIHSEDASCLTDASQCLLDPSEAFMLKPVNADRFLNNGDRLSLGDCTLEVLYTPGHSRGSVCFVYVREHIVFTGDTLFCRTVGRTDLNGGSVLQLSASIDKLMLLSDEYTVYPGHNRATTIGAERTGNRYMRRR